MLMGDEHGTSSFDQKEGGRHHTEDDGGEEVEDDGDRHAC